MQPIAELSSATRLGIRFVLTNVDDTLTYKGRLASATYAALEQLQAAGLVVVPITAAPAGWCDLMVRQWPVNAVVGENGGLCFSRTGASEGNIKREFWLTAAERARSMAQLSKAAERIVKANTEVRTAADQRFRLTTWALELEVDGEQRAKIAEAARAAWHNAGARSTINSLWVLGWFGDFDKLSMALRMGPDLFSTDLASDRSAVIYVGDSLNDEPMFRFFPNSVGVSTVADYLDQMNSRPRWITKGAGGAGFVEVAEAILAAR
jgi:HAD superfamily hydrolase (TIGR01484 family)